MTARISEAVFKLVRTRLAQNAERLQRIGADAALFPSQGYTRVHADGKGESWGISEVETCSESCRWPQRSESQEHRNTRGKQLLPRFDMTVAQKQLCQENCDLACNALMRPKPLLFPARSLVKGSGQGYAGDLTPKPPCLVFPFRGLRPSQPNLVPAVVRGDERDHLKRCFL